jgi:GNAT superfamily N-acetyltransferase
MNSAGQYRIEPLDSAKHRRKEFRCESPELTDFLQKRARKEMEARLSACFVIVPLEDPGRIAGYYTLSAATIISASLPPATSKRLPHYPEFPATLLGRLARDLVFRGNGIGDKLMVSALSRALESSDEVGSLAIITDPKDQRAKEFYTEFGFQPLTETRMYLPMREIPAILGA